MAGRLVVLFVIACASGAAAVTVSNARAGEPPAPATHLPAIPAAAPAGNRCPIPARHRQEFVHAARDTKLPLALLTAVARVESELKPDSSLPGKNVLAGARYLKLLLERLPSSELALAAYNAGPKEVASAEGAPSDETLTYVADVTSIWRSLAGCR